MQPPQLPTDDCFQLAVQAASEVARSCGLAFENPVVLQSVSNIIVHLQPTAVVARVAAVPSTIRNGDAWFTRELAVAQHLAAANAPIIPPSRQIDPGPHQHNGFTLSFWDYVQILPEPFDPVLAGRALRVCHWALSSFTQELPVLALITEAKRILSQLTAQGIFAPADADLLAQVSAPYEESLRGLPMQPLHGDSHSGNVLHTSLGVLWTDWEDAFIGPIEWDLASLVANPYVFGVDQDKAEAALWGYGTYDPQVLALCIEIRTFVALVWSVIQHQQQPSPERQERVEYRLNWFRQRQKGDA
ncbi:MAG: aminoglycoside phosphotransferase family protein [Cyanobacteria bacterium Co-bin13]|nr:aminoglycoside phosphotransferase family protein [Cyanobacteria bacterium Co-bin13]